MRTAGKTTLYHVHDPMCSWCWGYRETWNSLRAQLPVSVTVVNVLGGLAADTDQLMPREQCQAIAGYWRKINKLTGAQFNFDFWDQCAPRRSTYPACRAVLGAAHQGAEERMIDAIQQAYYLRAMNPSDNSVLIVLAGELNLNQEQFSLDINSEGTHLELEENVSLGRRIHANSFPSLILEINSALIPIDIDYLSHKSALKSILNKLAY
jgi:putative protein-disulfide isomerase